MLLFDGDNFYSVDPDINYRTGEVTTYGMHIDGVTDAVGVYIAQVYPTDFAMLMGLLRIFGEEV